MFNFFRSKQKSREAVTAEGDPGGGGQSRNVAEMGVQLENEKRNLVSQETRYQEKLSELSSQLAARESEANRLHLVIEDLKRELVAKASGMDRLQAELESSNKEGEYVKQTLRRLENDVTGFRHKNTELVDELQKKADEIEALKEEKTKLEVEKKAMEENSEDQERMEVVEELKRKVKELEESVAEAANERDRVGREKRRLEAEREEEMKIVQEALDEAIEEKASIQARFERDFERLRTVNTDREQKLLDDFEWKLREVEAKCKRKLEERERATEEKLKAVRQETDVAKQELAALKTHEAELVQLRGLSHEQQRSIRMGARQIESLQVSEKILQEEASNLRELLEQERARLNAMQGIHDKKLADMEKSWKNRLEALRNELNFSSEVRLKKEKVQLKTELEALHLGEKKKLKEETSAKMICERRELERKLKAATDEVVQLKTTVENKEAIWRRELEKTRANSDRDILDLRRKLDKLDMSYQDQIENMTSKHQRELETLNEEAEQRLAASEQNWQMQLSSTRTTLELVKEQMERDAQKRVEALQNEYQSKLEYQWKRLNEEKEIAILTVERKFIQQLEILKEEMENSSKISTAQESEHHHEKIELLKKELISQNKVIDDLEGNVNVLQGEMQVLNEELNDQSGEMKKYQSETEKTIREKELQMEALQLRELEMVRNSGSQEALKAELQALRDAFQREPSSPSGISEEWRRESEVQGPRPEDERLTADLRHSPEESDLSPLTEEKRFERPEPSNRPTAPVRRRGCEAASPREGREKDFPERDRSTGSVATPRRDSRNSSPGPSVGGPTRGETSCGHKPCDRLRPTVASPAAAAADPSSNRIRSRSLDFGLPFDPLSTAPLPHSARPAHRELHSPSLSAPVLPFHTSSSLPMLPSPEDNGSENVSSSLNGREHLDPVPRDPTPPQ